MEVEAEGGEEDEGAAEEQAKEPAPSKQIDLAQSFDARRFAAAVAAEAEGGAAAEAEGRTGSSAVRDGVRRIFHGEEAQLAMEVAAEAAANAAAALADLIARGEPLFTMGVQSERPELPLSPRSPTRSRSEALWLHLRHRGREPHSPSGSLAPSRSPSGEPKSDVATEPDVAADMADTATPSRRARRDNAAVVGVVTGVVAAGGSGLREALLPLLEQEQPTHPVTFSSSTTDSVVAELVKASIDAAVEADQTLRDATLAKQLAETAVATKVASTAKQLAKQLILTAVERALVVIEAKQTELHRLTSHYDQTRIYKVGDRVSLDGKIFQMVETPGLSGYSPSRPADLLWRFIANGPPAVQPEPPVPPVPPEPPEPSVSPSLKSPEQLPIRERALPSPAAASPAERASAKLQLLMLELQELHELQELQERSAALDAALAAEAPFLAATALQAAQRGGVVRKRLSFQAEADAALKTLLVLEAELTEAELSGLQDAADRDTLIPPPPDEPEPQPEADTQAPPVLIGKV